MDLSECKLCPRNCGIDRGTALGFCGADKNIKIGRYSLHMWEEPCISGESGSGTVFFSHCNLKCGFCQNSKISNHGSGKYISVQELADIFLSLQQKSANNINLVTATHYIPQIISALDSAKVNGLTLPILYNCGGYESVEALKMLDGYIDIYMPDFKFWRSATAQKYANAPNYPEVAKAAIAEMVRQATPCQFENGLMKKGVIVRHLVLPGLLYESKKIIDYLFNTYGNSIYISIMSQYTPMPDCQFPELCRKVGKKEYESLCNYAESLGIENAYIQEGESACESFIPDFY